ncbi:MAG: AlpA family transcriptional regulator [Pseudomonadota bacterium]
MAYIDKQQITILRLKQVQGRTGLSRSTIYDRMGKGTFPYSISLGARAVGWLESEINAWLFSCIQIRAELTGSITN